jgi:hypothetical protein
MDTDRASVIYDWDEKRKKNTRLRVTYYVHVLGLSIVQLLACPIILLLLYLFVPLYVGLDKYKYRVLSSRAVCLLIFRRIPGAARESIEYVTERILQCIVR